jgi:dienelactone hydrolase
MRRPLCLVVAGLVLAASAVLAAEPDPTRVLDGVEIPKNRRPGPPRTLNDYFPFAPPASKEAWEIRRKEVREEVLVATGLWPLPDKTPLRPVIHGKIDRDGYTIEKVFFASYPGHYVCGNLYRPKGKKRKLPGVLCPHGHWHNGRFYDAGEKRAKELIAHGDEKTIAGARYPLQARCAHLARMGCVVFHYDMVGNADSRQIAHRAGFTDVKAELRLQSFMGLQTWNSIRALDFLLSLPEVDARRIGVTGASGGGTQTFILCAIDDRPAAAFPAVMVSTAMQGGCICENCSYLRQDTGNVELAALFAPKPLGMTGANDWTKDIETKGLPELKALYKLYGAEDRVMAKCFKQFEHNYNQVSREVMYNWFNKHLRLKQKEPVVEKPFVPVPPTELSVFDEDHPLPKDAVGAKKLRQYLSEASDKQMAALQPRDAQSLKKFQTVVRTALRVMINDRIPNARMITETPASMKVGRDGITWERFLLERKGARELVPAISVRGKKFNGTVVVWVHSKGKSSLLKKGKLVPEAQRILNSKAAILAVDVFQTGELKSKELMPIHKDYAGYTFGYNRPLLANRVHDILTAVAYARGHQKTRKVMLVGLEEAGPWVVLARALCGKTVDRTAADLQQFQFAKVSSVADENMLPGAVKYGGIPAFAALAAPGELYLFNGQGIDQGLLKAAYKAAGKPYRAGSARPLALAESMDWNWLLQGN